MKNKLIVVDDDPIVIELIQVALAKYNFEILAFTSAKEALASFIANPTLVIVSDLNMPEMSGVELIQNIVDLGHKPIFIILTSETDTKKVIELFKQGVHDYIIKPFNPAELSNRISKAFEFAEMRIINENIKKEREIRIEHQLNWNLFKEKLIKKDSDKVESGLMANINTNLIQGAGLGTLSALGEMVKGDYKLENDRYSVDKDLLDMLLKNLDVSGKLISTVAAIDYVITHDLPKEKLSLSEIPILFQDVISDNENYQNLKGHQVKLSENKFENSSLKLSINIEYFQKVIKELLINAFKFSEPRSKIYILFEIQKESLQISFLNFPAKNTQQAAGIPTEYQQILFEPFFRLSKFVFEQYDTLDYGLGLCYAEKIIQNHKGKITISNLKNFLENNQSMLINFMIELPFLS
jgi:DNA-binding response OmpR family regulator